MCKLRRLAIDCLFACLLFMIFKTCFAMPVLTVFRGDANNYADVFQYGIKPWGNNINYLSHILGVSGFTGSRNSAFISTSSRSDVAMGFARNLALVRGVGYLYEIRATDNIYSALETIDYLFTLHNERISDDLRSTVNREQEYSAYVHISPEQVRSVTVITYDSNGYHSEVINNPNYIDRQTRSHDGPFTQSGRFPLDIRPRLLVMPEGFGADNVSPEDVETRSIPPVTWSLCCINSNQASN